MTFAEVHLEMLSGNYRSRKALRHKGDSIKAVNAKLSNPENALSNETIGAVAMLAAMNARHEALLLTCWLSDSESAKTDRSFRRLWKAATKHSALI